MYAQVAERDRNSGPTELSMEDVLAARLLYGAATHGAGGSRAEIKVIKLSGGAAKDAANAESEASMLPFVVDEQGVPL